MDGTIPNRADSPPDRADVEVTYYTDPLCPWSWALEPQWRRLRFEYGGRIAHRSVMGGMIPDWRSYHDALNAVHNPSQMAPQWYQIRQLSGMPLDERILHDDPPESSYPACLAVKAAERQGLGEVLLRRVREAVMLERRNIARGEVLLELADGLAADPPRGMTFDALRFRDDLIGPEVRDAFHEDLREVRYRNIGRFPTLVLCAGGGPGIALVGYRPYEVIRSVLDRLSPDLRPLRDSSDLIAYVSYWGRVTGREAAEALGLTGAAASRSLDDAVAMGALIREGSMPEWYRVPS